ncbi:MAG: hypothetical protein HOW73_02180 [Polyangiaceae bacterium]|nr:hypothetical protein [Polyangiaceae bacterium]
MSTRRAISVLSTIGVLSWCCAAEAAPLVIPSEASEGGPGAAGTGACALARKASDGNWISELNDALLLLGKPLDQTAGERVFTVTTPDYTNGTIDSLGDFIKNVPMPFSPSGTPFGDGQRIAMRWKGLLRITNPGTSTLAIRSDDGFRLKIGGEVVLEHVGVQTSKVASRQITFDAPGRYPFELVYFENLTDAVIEWSAAPGLRPEVYESETLPSGFVLLPTAMLLPPMSDPATCGPSCLPCEPEAPFCIDGECVDDPSIGMGGGDAGGGDVGGSGGASSEGGATSVGGFDQGGAGAGGELAAGGGWQNGSGGSPVVTPEGGSGGSADADGGDPSLWGSSVGSCTASATSDANLGLGLVALALIALGRRRQ